LFQSYHTLLVYIFTLLTLGLQLSIIQRRIYWVAILGTILTNSIWLESAAKFAARQSHRIVDVQRIHAEVDFAEDLLI